MNREIFLQDVWQAYPPAPSTEQKNRPKSWHWGRVAELRPSHKIVGAWDLSLQCEGEVKKLTIKGDAPVIQVKKPIDTATFLSCVQPQDWLAVSEQGELLFLAPCLQPPLVSSSSRQTLQEWDHFRRQVEGFFRDRGFLQVSTPTLVVSPGTETHLVPFATEWSVGSERHRRFLPTSPELSLKKMLSQGYSQLFEIRSCFRNEEISPRHQPEFQMLEWYRSFSSLEEIREDVIGLLRTLTGDVRLSASRVSIAELFERHLGFHLTPQTSKAELGACASDLGLVGFADDNWDDLFFRIFVDHIEPRLDSSEPLFVEKYPPSQAALARLTADGWGDRFELYWRGMEIANAYHELTDPQIQRARIEHEVSQRSSVGRSEVPVDAAFLAALDSGMPPSAGIALGLERLFLVLTKRKNLTEIRPFAETSRGS